MRKNLNENMNHDAMCFIPNAWLEAVPKEMSFEEFGLAGFLIACSHDGHDKHIHWRECLTKNECSTKNQLIKILQGLHQLGITQMLENGDWHFTAPQPKRPLNIIIVMADDMC